jgi:hypothetical protein
MAAIAAERVVRYLERGGFVVMKKPPIGGHSPLGFRRNPATIEPAPTRRKIAIMGAQPLSLRQSFQLLCDS